MNEGGVVEGSVFGSELESSHRRRRGVNSLRGCRVWEVKKRRVRV